MSGLGQIRALYAYNEWAAGHVLDAAGLLSEEELARELGASFGSVQGNLSHIAGAQVIWLRRWTGEKSDALALLTGEAPFEDVRKAFEVSHARLREFVTSLTEDGLERLVEYVDTQGNRQQPFLWQTLLHVANHGTHHRAETALLLTALGKPPRQLDYVFYELECAGAPPRLT